MPIQPDKPELTEDDLRAIEQADAEFDRGEYIEFEAWAAAMRRKYGLTGDDRDHQAESREDC
jgi:hypothetical protein